MSKEKTDKVTFYIRKDFAGEDKIEHRHITRGDSVGLRCYIMLFMNTTVTTKPCLRKLYIPCPQQDSNRGAFTYV